MDYFPKIIYTPFAKLPVAQPAVDVGAGEGGRLRPDPDDVQTLSRISDRYSAGAISNVVKRTLTQRRVDR